MCGKGEQDKKTERKKEKTVSPELLDTVQILRNTVNIQDMIGQHRAAMESFRQTCVDFELFRKFAIENLNALETMKRSIVDIDLLLHAKQSLEAMNHLREDAKRLLDLCRSIESATRSIPVPLSAIIPNIESIPSATQQTRRALEHYIATLERELAEKEREIKELRRIISESKKELKETYVA